MLRYYHYAYRTEQTYVHWILRDLYDCGGKSHPNRLGAKDVERLLAHLRTEGTVSASTPRQTPNALVLLDRDVRHTPLERTIAPIRSQRRPRLPTVRTRAEIQ